MCVGNPSCVHVLVLRPGPRHTKGRSHESSQLSGTGVVLEAVVNPPPRMFGVWDDLSHAPGIPKSGPELATLG